VTDASIRRRLAGQAAFRYLTDEEAQALLGMPKFVNESVKWQPSRASETRVTEVRMAVAVSNPRAENLLLGGRIALATPGRSHWRLTWGDKAHGERPEEIRRLDLRDGHVNPDGKRFERQTHKHRWSVADSNRWAYVPSDIPHDVDGGPQTQDDYRAIFEAFAAECSIDLGPFYVWQDPPMDYLNEPTLWEVP
jgi:hypothetical protein